MQRFRLFAPVLTLLLLCIPSMMKAQELQGTINGTAMAVYVPAARFLVGRMAQGQRASNGQRPASDGK